MSSAVIDQTLNGEHKKWHSNGKLKIHTFYKDGNEDGEAKYWHDNGQLYIHTFYKNGKFEGEYKFWYYDGQLYVHAFYKDGMREGEYKLWHLYGQLELHEYYMNGVVIDRNFTIHKKHIWTRYFQRLRYRASLRRLSVILDRFLILDLIKICAKY